MQQIIEMAKGFDWSPFWISLKTGIIATVICFFLGLFAARKVLKMGPTARAVVDGILTLPMVMAPTVAGFFLLLLFSLRGGGAIPAVAGLLLIGFSYGGMPTMTSTVTADCFGTQNYGTNFSIANMSMLPASFGATIVGAIQTGSGTYVTAFLVFLGVTAVVILLDLAFRGAAKKL